MKRRTITQDVDREIGFHLEERARELVAQGMDPRTAHAEALRAFGDDRRIRSECREITRSMNQQKGLRNMLDGLWQDFRYALRTLRHAPGFTTVAVLTLALGIGANTAIFSVVNGVLLRPLPYPEADRLVRVWERLERGGDNHVTWANFVDWRDSAESFEAMALHPSFAFGGASTVIGGDRPSRVLVSSVSREFFDAMGVDAVIGRTHTDEEQSQGGPAAAVVSYGFWQTQLGGTEQLDERPLRIGSGVYEVVGVMPPGFRYPVDTDVWTALERFEHGMSRTSHNYALVARLRPGVTEQAARAELDGITATLKQQYGDEMNAVGINLRSLQEEIVGVSRTPLMLMLGAAALVLLVASTNLASTLLARASSRRREMAIRSSVGAGRAHIVRQMLVESLVLAGAGAVVGILLANVVLRGLLDLGPSLPRVDEIGLHPAVLGFTAVVTIATALLFGIVPALRATRADGAEALRGSGPGSAGGNDAWVWKGLVSTEVALALVLLVGAGLLTQSFAAVMSMDAGIDPEGVITADLSVPSANHPEDPDLIAYYERLLTEVGSLPGVDSVGAINHLPLGGAWINGAFLIEGRDELQDSAHYRAITRGYFDAMRIPVLNGRTFNAADQRGAPGVVVVNEAFADYYFPEESAVGRRIGSLSNDGWVYGDEWLTIVGVVGNVRHSGLTAEPLREIYVNGMQRPMRLRSGVLVVRGSSDLGPAIREKLALVDPEVPTELSTMNAIVAASTADRRFLMIVLAVFAGVGLTLSAVGIYGVVSYAVAQRTREMGIRIALGAAPSKVRNLVVRNAMRMVVAGLVVGVAGALALSRLLGSLLWQVSPSDPLTIAGVVLLLATTGWLASFVPALRGSRVDPLVTMRGD